MGSKLEKVSEIIESFGYEQAQLIAIMQGIQAEFNYLSEEALMLVAEKLQLSPAKVYSVATFYENFSLEAKGKHIIKVVPVRHVTSVSPARSMMQSMSIWDCPARKRLPTTECLRWKLSPVWAPVVWLPL